MANLLERNQDVLKKYPHRLTKVSNDSEFKKLFYSCGVDPIKLKKKFFEYTKFNYKRLRVAFDHPEKLTLKEADLIKHFLLDYHPFIKLEDIFPGMEGVAKKEGYTHRSKKALANDLMLMNK